MTQEEAFASVDLIVRCLKRATPSDAVRTALKAAEALQADIKLHTAQEKDLPPPRQHATPVKEPVRITKEAADVTREEDDKIIAALRAPVKESE